jgi:formylmethanofuran dehydrogenase subunit A
MTADGPWQYTLYELSSNKWINHDVETETGSGIVPFRYRPKSYVHAIMWSIGLELSLLIKDPWRVYLTTDHPNAAPFTTYPTIIAWLMSKKARESTLLKINKRAKTRSLLPSIDREYDLFEITIATRSGQGRALGLSNKGHLEEGSDADVAIYDINPEKINPSRDYRTIKKAFERTKYTIKDGEILVKNGEIVQTQPGRIMWSNINLSSPIEITSNLKKRFREYWTIEYENYIIPESYITHLKPISIKAEL